MCAFPTRLITSAISTQAYIRTHERLNTRKPIEQDSAIAAGNVVEGCLD